MQGEMKLSRKGLITIFKRMNAFLLVLCLILQIFPLPQEISAGQWDEGVTKKRPYFNDSPWNLKIGDNPVYDPYSDIYIDNLHGPFGANPNMYALPIYEVSKNTPLIEVILSGWYSNVVDNGTRLIKKWKARVNIPIPSDARPAKGTDSTIVIWNTQTGDEWGFWKSKKLNSQTWMARNGYHYNTNWNAVPPYGFISRGAGVPKLVGVIRPWELKKGKIDHAIGFAVNYPSSLYIYPASMSDGQSMHPAALPEGARLQLNPTLTKKDFNSWGMNREGFVIAKALQEYGMILTDGSDHPKISIEYQGTAHWGDLLNKNIVENIPYSAFKLLSLSTPKRPIHPKNLSFEIKKKHIFLKWDPSPTATRYRVKRRQQGKKDFKLLDKWVTKTYYVDKVVKSGAIYEYKVIAVNCNGLSQPSQVKIFYNGG